jgi:hypothetical protein
MASFYVETTGSNTYPFSSRETAALSFFELFNALNTNEHILTSADIIYIHGLVYEPNNFGYYELNEARLIGEDSLVDRVNMSTTCFEGGSFLNVSLFTDELGAEHNILIYSPISVVHCRFDGGGFAQSAISSNNLLEVVGSTFSNFIGYAIDVQIAGVLGQFVGLGQTQRNWTGLAASPNGDVYACAVNGDIYKQTGGVGNFVALGQINRSWSHPTVAPNGDVYICVNAEDGNIYKQTGGVGNFTTLDQVSNFWIAVAAAANGDIYACVNTGDIYKQTGGIGNFVALGQTIRDWVDLCVAPNGDVYATVSGGDIYKQTGGTGNFVALGQEPRYWYGITARSNGDIYACVVTGDIYKQTGGVGNFVALNQTSREWYDLTTDVNGDILGCVFPGDIYKMSFANADIDLTVAANSIDNSSGIAFSLTDIAIGQLHLFNNAFNSGSYDQAITIALVNSLITNFIHSNNVSNLGFEYTEDGEVFAANITELPTNPLFLGIDPNPLLIDSSSPCYRVGRTLTEILTTDILGVTYANPPSIGAYEVDDSPTVREPQHRVDFTPGVDAVNAMLVPFQDLPTFVEEVVLGSTPLRFTFCWNSVAARWILDISDANDNLILAGINILFGVNLLGNHSLPSLPVGTLFVVDQNLNHAEIQQGDFVNNRKLQLIYVGA